MKNLPAFVGSLVVLACVGSGVARGQAPDGSVLPPGVSATWDTSRAFRERTPSKERICINGLWRWQPAALDAPAEPADSWGFFKVPGPWPGITDYMQKDAQTVFAHPSWRGRRLSEVAAAWYQREIDVPREWTGRRIALTADYVNSIATVWVDGTRAGSIRYPGGELDLTAHCRPGVTHRLSLLVEALPLKAVLLSYTDTNTAREVKGRVARRGLCGDLFLTGTPAEARITDVRISTSYRRRSIELDAALSGLAAGRRYTIEAHITRRGQVEKTFTSREISAADLSSGRVAFSAPWDSAVLWDLDTPENLYQLRCTLAEAGGRIADVDFDRAFGFREFWIDGREFLLNGSPIHLRVVPLDNAQVSAGLASYAGARESLERLKSIGINFVYTHNYGCEPGSHLSFTEVLRAADDVGMLVSFSQPHFSHYDWKAADADHRNGYAQHAEFYVRAAQNHPAVVAYAMNHNALGYAEDMNPDLIDGTSDPRDQRAQAGVKLAQRTEAIVRRWDPSRVIYHHSSGNFGSMHTINFYPNFAPRQELSDWFEHWETTGTKPVFLCEYGAPFTWDWAMYRGWYKGERSFGSARVPWQFCLAEWNAQFFGDRAFRISTQEAANLRWEARQLADGRDWFRWDYPHQLGSSDFDERHPVFALYLADNWPAYRARGVSAISPWEFGPYWKVRPGIDRRRQDLPVNWPDLQRPGLSTDYVEGRYERFDLAFNRADWLPTVAAETLVRYNRPLLACLAGKAAAVTSKDHVFTPGSIVEKQLLLINDSRRTIAADATWSLDLPVALTGARSLTVAPGRQERIPLRFPLPDALPPGEYTLNATVRFDTGESQRDTFRIHVLARPQPVAAAAPVALFDPQGETSAVLRRMGVRFQRVDASASLADFDTLIIGRSALTPESPAPDISRVRTGLKVLIFEQSAATLEKRFGFRIAEYGLRQVFRRVAHHPVLAGMDDELLRDWRGEATLQPPRLASEMRPRFGSSTLWCGIPVTRLWRCGNRGNVASVVIEKPARGDFLPLLDGGYQLQFSPLLEYREGRGLVIFCQLDLTGRTEDEPAADQIVRNLLGHLGTWKPRPARHAVYVGDVAGQAFLESAGVPLETYRGGSLPADRVLILGPGAGHGARLGKSVVAEFLKAGGRVTALGLDAPDLDALMPVPIGVRSQEHISTFFEPLAVGAAFAGVGPADLHNRRPQQLPLVASGATVIGNGVIATAESGAITLCQLLPWTFDPLKASNLKRTFRRAAFAVTRVLANQGVESRTPILGRCRVPCDPAQIEKRWLNGLYLDQPEEWDDPYRFFRW